MAHCCTVLLWYCEAQYHHSVAQCGTVYGTVLEWYHVAQNHHSVAQCGSVWKLFDIMVFVYVIIIILILLNIKMISLYIRFLSEINQKEVNPTSNVLTPSKVLSNF